MQGHSLLLNKRLKLGQICAHLLHPSRHQKSSTANIGPNPCHHPQLINLAMRTCFTEGWWLPGDHVHHLNILYCTALPKMTCINVELNEIASYLATALDESSFCYLTASLQFLYWFCNNPLIDFPFLSQKPFLGVGEIRLRWRKDTVTHSPPVLGWLYLGWSPEMNLKES